MEINLKYSKGVMMIAQERWEQIHKHQRTWDAQYTDGELVQAALYSVKPDLFSWPYGWDNQIGLNIRHKDQVGRLKVAGALIAAEIDKLLEAESRNEAQKLANEVESNS